MKQISFFTGLLFPVFAYAAPPDSTQLLRAFPITAYNVPLNDTGIVVQVLLPSGSDIIKNKQIGLLRGIAVGESRDTGSKGWGKCHLIKGDYYYFAIHQTGNARPKAGDLIYTFTPKPNGLLLAEIGKTAAHAILFTDVDDSAFYDIGVLLSKWTKTNEESMLEIMVNDIRRTGAYFRTGSPEMNQQIEAGDYKGRGVLDVMAVSVAPDVQKFLRYVAARPLLYAGNRWKMSETFATWLMAGAPQVAMK